MKQVDLLRRSDASYGRFNQKQRHCLEFLRMFRTHFMRIVFIIVGLLLLALGMLGIFLPLLPTVPFILLAAACFSRGSKRMHAWLVRLPFAGKVIDDYEQGRGVPRRAKITALLMLWGGMTTSAILIAPPWWVLALLAVTAIFASGIIVRLPKAIEPGTEKNVPEKIK